MHERTKDRISYIKSGVQIDLTQVKVDNTVTHELEVEVTYDPKKSATNIADVLVCALQTLARKYK